MTAPQDVMVADVERGDLLMVTAHPRSAFAALILALDGAPGNFSHCGVALGDGKILSARYDPQSLLPFDLGGLYRDPFAYFWGEAQLIHRADVHLTDRAAVLARLDSCDHAPGGFSVPKIVAIAAALHALRPGTPIGEDAQARVVRRAMSFARAWGGDGDFYCAEFVATVYGWNFTIKDLVPPESRRRVTIPRTAQVMTHFAALALAPFVSDRQLRTLHALVWEIVESDPAFLGPHLAGAVEDFLRLAARTLGLPQGKPRAVDDSPLDPEQELPRALVTPRMVLSKHLEPGLPPLVRRRRRSAR